MTKCADWLRHYLRGGMSVYEAVKEDAKRAGFTTAELKAARKELGIKTWHQIGPAFGVEHWFWYLPEGQG